MAAPLNDNFADALLLTGNSGSAGPITIDEATVEAGEPTGVNVIEVDQTVWFKWIADLTGNVSFDTLGSLATDGNGDISGRLDTTMSVWVGTDLTSLAEINSNDNGFDDPDNFASKVQFKAIAGTTYYIQVGTASTPYTGSLILNWLYVTSASPKLLGSGIVDSSTVLTVVLDHDVPNDGVLQLIWANVAENTGFVDVSDIVDSKLHQWFANQGSTLSIIGLISGNTGSFPNITNLHAGSVVRNCVAGDLVAGDTVTLTLNSDGSIGSCALLVYVSSELQPVSQTDQGWSSGAVNGNGSSWPDFGFSNTELSWEQFPITSFGAQAQPDNDAIMITAMAAYPAEEGFSPFLPGTLIAEVAGACSLACCVTNVPAGDIVDPGGVWPTNALLLAGNYQFAIPKLFPFTAQSIFWFYKDGAWHNATVDSEYDLHYFKDGAWHRTSEGLQGRLSETWQQ